MAIMAECLFSSSSFCFSFVSSWLFCSSSDDALKMRKIHVYQGRSTTVTDAMNPGKKGVNSKLQPQSDVPNKLYSLGWVLRISFKYYLFHSGGSMAGPHCSPWYWHPSLPAPFCWVPSLKHPPSPPVLAFPDPFLSPSSLLLAGHYEDLKGTSRSIFLFGFTAMNGHIQYGLKQPESTNNIYYYYTVISSIHCT